MKSVLGAPLQDIFRCRGPFLALQELGLTLIECAAKMPSQVVDCVGPAKQLVGACPIEPRIVINHLMRQGWIFVPYARNKSIEVSGYDIAARQRSISRPGAGHRAEIRLQL